MAITITCDSVRGRLQVDASVLGDAVLNSDSYIPAGIALVNKKLALKSLAYDEMSEDDQLLVRNGIVCMVAMRALVNGEIDDGATFADFKVGGKRAAIFDRVMRGLKNEAFAAFSSVGLVGIKYSASPVPDGRAFDDMDNEDLI